MKVRLSTLLLWVFVAALSGATVLSMMDAFSMLPYQSRQLLITLGPALWIATVCALLAALCALARERGRAPWLMLSGIIACGAALLTWLGILLLEQPVIRDDQLNVMLTVVTIASAWGGACAAIGVLLLPRFAPGPSNIVRMGTIVMVILLAVQIMLWVGLQPNVDSYDYNSANWVRSYNFNEGMAQLFGVLMVLFCGGCVTVFVLAQMRRLSGEEIVADEDRMSFHATCPRCRLRSELRSHGDSCRSCGLRIKVVPQ
ncbi:MAG: hypothetical protein ACR2GY_03005 [Phycisphaerales bacterium]